MWYAFALLIGMAIGLVIGIFRTESSIYKNARKWVKRTGRCYLCPDCPATCPLEYPDANRNADDFYNQVESKTAKKAVETLNNSNPEKAKAKYEELLK